jgi:prepilin-type N-terminal cleavage/methylation domain-containing protein
LIHVLSLLKRRNSESRARVGFFAGGYTLTEMLTVVAVLAILTSMTMVAVCP